METLLNAWNITKDFQVEDLHPFIGRKLIITSDQRYLLKTKLDQTQILRELAILNFVRNHGIPVTLPLPTTEGSPYSMNNNTCYCLYPYVEGNSIVPETMVADLSWADRCGTVLGSLHRVLARFPSPEQVFDVQVPIFFRLEKDLASMFHLSPGVYNDSLILNSLSSLEEDYHSQVPSFSHQIIHRDFHLDNLLFTGSHSTAQLAAILDFELVTYGIKLFDLCYFVSSLLSSLFNPEKNNYSVKWYQILHFVLVGYLRTNSLNSAEKEGFYSVLLQIQLLFLLFFHTRDVPRAKHVEAMVFWLTQQKTQLDEALSN